MILELVDVVNPKKRRKAAKLFGEFAYLNFPRH